MSAIFFLSNKIAKYFAMDSWKEKVVNKNKKDKQLKATNSRERK